MYSINPSEYYKYILNENNVLITEDYLNSIFTRYNINYKIKDLSTFQTAMTHMSYSKSFTLNEKNLKIFENVKPIDSNLIKKCVPLQQETYALLEFLGDATLHKHLTMYIFKRYGNMKEGFLTELRIKLEKSSTCHKLCVCLGLEKYALIARNVEEFLPRKENKKMCEDIFESFLGALSLEAPDNIIYDLITRLYESEVNFTEIINTVENYKNEVIKYFHIKKWGVPKFYENVSEHKSILSGTTVVHFYTMVLYREENGNQIFLASGEDNTKSAAEQNACKLFLKNISA